MSVVATLFAALGGCWLPPVQAPVREPFIGPACTWCPGHRGLEFASVPGTPVVNAVGGVVSFSGVVVGRRFVTVRVDGDDNETLVTYGPLASAMVAVDQTVSVGQIVGTSGDGVMVSVRINDIYVDPAQFLGRWRWPLRLIPADGEPAPPAPPPSLVCG